MINDFHNKWSWRVKKFHDLYIMSFYVCTAGLSLIFFINAYNVIIRNKSIESSISGLTIYANMFVLIVYTNIFTQTLTRLIFGNCPLTILEYHLRGRKNRLDSYWVSKLSYNLITFCLISITVIVYLLVCFCIIYLKCFVINKGN